MFIQRINRISELIKITIANIIRKEINNKILNSITITDVQLTKDCRIAKIYFVQLGSDDNSIIVKNNLEKALGFIKKKMCKKLKIRYMPKLICVYDYSFKHMKRIEKILNEIKK